jgi:hypothetical protein
MPTATLTRRVVRPVSPELAPRDNDGREGVSMGRVNQFLKERPTASNRDLGRLVVGLDGRLRCRNCRAADIFRRRPKGAYLARWLPIAMIPRTHYCGVCRERN